MTAGVFKEEIDRLFSEEKSKGADHIDITSGDVHRTVGGYPSKNHNMPTCCEVMYSLMKPGDEILKAPPKGKGATLEIRYHI